MPLRTRMTGGQRLIWRLSVKQKVREVLGEVDPSVTDRIADLLVSDVETIISDNSANDAVIQRALPPSAVLTRLAQTMRVIYPEAAQWVQVTAEGWREREIREGWPTDDRWAAFKAGYKKAWLGVGYSSFEAPFSPEMYEEWLATQEPEQQKPEGC